MVFLCETAEYTASEARAAICKSNKLDVWVYICFTTLMVCKLIMYSDYNFNIFSQAYIGECQGFTGLFAYWVSFELTWEQWNPNRE